MRKRKKRKKLRRNSSQRKLLYRGLMNSLIQYGSVRTTLAKAKAVRPLFEKLVTKAKMNERVNRLQVFRVLRNKKSAKKIFSDHFQTLAKRNGGYCRIIRLVKRKGDNTQCAILEIVGGEKE